MSSDLVLYEGSDDEVRLPTRYEVCSRCRGEGTHDAWDGGMTASEMHEQGDEFIADYRRGLYSVPCTECHGQRVVAVADEARCTPEQLRAYEDDRAAEADMRAEMAAERAAGC